jgi:PadR family transcriptional regulator, regulatory protein PadR
MTGKGKGRNQSGRQRMRTYKAVAEHHQDLFTNVIHLYVLRRASEDSIFGLQILEELSGLGFKLSPGTIYPLLEALERKRLVRSREVSNGSIRRLYRSTAAGRKALSDAEDRVRRIFGGTYMKRNKIQRKDARRATGR